MTLEAFKCPSCSAPLKYETESGDTIIICDFCSSSIAVPEHLVKEQLAPPISTLKETRVSYQATAQTYNPTPVAPPKQRRGCILFLAIIIVVLGAIAPLFFFGLIPTNAISESVLEDRGGPVEVVEEAIRSSGYATRVNAFGTEGTGEGQFTDIRSVTVDSEGRIYVGEYIDANVKVFTSEGEYLRQWSLDSDTPLVSLAADGSGNIYAIYGSQIHQLDAETGQTDGAFQVTFDRGFEDVAIGPNDSVITSWLRGGQGNQIIWFTPQGVVMQTMNVNVDEDGSPELDASVAVDPSGNVYMLAGFADLVLKFSPEREFISVFGSPGDGEGQFQAVHDIAVDELGRVFVSDFKGVQVFDAEGQYLGLIDVEGPAFGMGFTPNNHLLVAARTQVIEYELPE